MGFSALSIGEKIFVLETIDSNLLLYFEKNIVDN